jgi:hypothetical protein
MEKAQQRELKIRVSTALLILALINLPFASYWVTLPEWMWQEPWKRYTAFYLIDFTGMAIAICMLINLISFAVFLSKKKWIASLQTIAETIASFMIGICLPAY